MIHKADPLASLASTAKGRREIANGQATPPLPTPPKGSDPLAYHDPPGRSKGLGSDPFGGVESGGVAGIML